MILTGSAIHEAIQKGDITIDPYNKNCLNPNSYNYRIGNTLKVFDKFSKGKAHFNKIELNDSGFILKPGQTYLANTLEKIGSDKYAMSLIGRSSLGRLGLFLQLSANLGHTLSNHKWTLEIVATKPIKIYSGMKIGQISFWSNKGDIKPYEGTYSKFNDAHEAIK